LKKAVISGLMRTYWDMFGPIGPLSDTRIGEGGLTGAKRLSHVPNGQGRVMILQALSDIRAGITAGQSSRALFDQLKSRLDGMSYRQFCRYADRVRQSVQNPDLQMIQPKRGAPLALLAAPNSAPAIEPGAAARPAPASIPPARTAQETNDGPKAPPRPRGFVRLGGLPDDNKDKLI
jgi:hypothetical protein